MGKKKSKAKKETKNYQNGINEDNSFVLSNNEETNSEDGFSLSDNESGDSNETFKLSNDDNFSDDFSLSDSTNSNTKAEKKIVDESSDYSIPLPIDKVYELLLKGKPISTSIEEFFKSNISVYRVIGLKPFQDPKDFEITRYSSWKEAWISDANNEWGYTDGDKVSLFTEAVDILGSIISNEKRYRNELREPLEANVYSQFELLIKDKCSDKVVNSDEMCDLVLSAKDLGLCNTNEAYEKTNKKIHEAIKRFGAEIKNYEEDFITFVQDLDSKKRIDSKDNKQNLLTKYKELQRYDKIINNIEKDDSDEELMVKMSSLLEKNNLEFLSGIDLYEKEFFNKEIEKLQIDLSLPLKNEYFYRLQEVARSYKVSEAEFVKFLEGKNISKEPDVQIKLNFGRIDGEALQANSFKEIYELFMNYPDRAIRKIYEGDLENFLADINRSDLEKKIKQIIIDYKDDEEAGLLKTCYTLLPSSPCDVGLDIVSNNIEEIAEEIEANLEYFQENMAGVENHPLQIWLEANEYDQFAEEIKRINDYDYENDDKNSKRAINEIILCLQENVFKRNGHTFYSPADIVKLNDNKLKNILVSELQDEDSKMFIWIEKKFEKLLDNVQEWKDLKRFNIVTLNYALEIDSPYHFKENILADEEKFINFFVEHSNDSIIDSFIKDEDNISEFSFWLENYQNSSLENSLIKYLNQIKKEKNYSKAFSNVITYLGNLLITENEFYRYFNDLLPLYDYSRNEGIITDQAYKEHISRVFNELSTNKAYLYKDFVQSYLSSTIENNSANEVDKDFLLKFFKLYFKDDIDRNYYETKIHPLIQDAIKKKIFSKDVEEDEKKFFIAKYYQEFYKSTDNDKRAELLSSIEALEKENKYVELYTKSVAKIAEFIQKQNVFIKNKNLAKRNMIYFLISLSVCLSLMCFNISSSINYNSFFAGIGVYSVGIYNFFAYLLGSLQGNAILATIVICIFTPIIRKMYRKSIISKDLYIHFDKDFQYILFTYLAEQMNKNTAEIFIPRTKYSSFYSAFSIVLRIFTALLSICCCVFIGITCAKCLPKAIYAGFGLILATFYTIKYYLVEKDR